MLVTLTYYSKTAEVCSTDKNKRSYDFTVCLPFWDSLTGSQQQMLRLDFEETGDLFPEETEALSLWLQNLLEAGLDGVIVSDYAKGVCSCLL